MSGRGSLQLAPQPGVPSAAILVVDDNPDAREVLCTVLELEGYRAIAVEGGVEALELLAHIAPPALILLDFMMPRMDGLEVVAALQTNASLASIPVVFVSASPEIAASGARYLRKPVLHEDLLRVVQEFCGPASPITLPA
jgi:CheY-like chemotaxis protein